MPPLFVRQRATEVEQILEEVVDVAAARVVRLDELLEFREEVRARLVDAQERVELSADGGFQLLELDILAAGYFEAFGKRFKVDGRDVDGGPVSFSGGGAIHCMVVGS